MLDKSNDSSFPQLLCYCTFAHLNVNEEAVIKQGKLRSYDLFKSKFQKEVYWETVKDVQKRKCLTQFRVSAHRLEIGSGRYKKRAVSERICKV